MSGVSLYIEGGGDAAETKAAIRQGMGEFLGDLRDAARRKSWRWKVVACGSRDAAKDAFLNARAMEPDLHAILLVDSETRVNTPPVQHLRTRDRWDLTGVPDADVHLMTQVTETWLVSDPETLQAFYGQEFNAGALPNHADIEQVDKARIEDSLENATRRTQKGRYHKIRHGGPLLGVVRPAVVRARCSHCERVFSVIHALVA